MYSKGLAVIVLAAGKGTRMKSPLAKVLQPLNRRPLLHYVLESLAPLKPDRWIVVVGFQSDRVRSEFADRGLEFVEQSEQLGTGHAAAQTELVLAESAGDVLVVCGDMPFVRSQTLAALVGKHQEAGAGCTLLTLKTSEKKDFGRIVRDSRGAVARIVEHNDATENEKMIDEWNAGVYCFDKGLFFKALGSIGRNNAQKEFYLTDTIQYIVENGFAIETVQIRDAAELFGINSMEDLQRAEQLLTEHIQSS